MRSTFNSEAEAEIMHREKEFGRRCQRNGKSSYNYNIVRAIRKSTEVPFEKYAIKGTNEEQ